MRDLDSSDAAGPASATPPSRAPDRRRLGTVDGAQRPGSHPNGRGR
ncbi:hypothetical protein [Agromyces sp. NPDC057865]